MALYKIENIFRKTEEKEFKTDKRAWNTLRKKMISEDGNGFFMTMYKKLKLKSLLTTKKNMLSHTIHYIIQNLTDMDQSGLNR